MGQNETRIATLAVRDTTLGDAHGVGHGPWWCTMRASWVVSRPHFVSSAGRGTWNAPGQTVHVNQSLPFVRGPSRPIFRFARTALSQRQRTLTCGPGSGYKTRCMARRH